MHPLLQQNFGYLFQDKLLQEISKVGYLKKLDANEVVLDIGNSVSNIPLVLEGAIKVLREDTDGNELLLYFVEKGDTCAMTLSCCWGTARSKIRAITETTTQLYMIPVSYLEQWMEQYPSWRNFILESYHTRMMELIETVDALAFLRMDERLLKYLQDKAKVLGTPVLQTTHQDIAFDMHTSRVVISRLLKKLETEQKIKMTRNSIEVLHL